MSCNQSGKNPPINHVTEEKGASRQWRTGPPRIVGSQTFEERYSLAVGGLVTLPLAGEVRFHSRKMAAESFFENKLGSMAPAVAPGPYLKMLDLVALGISSFLLKFFEFLLLLLLLLLRSLSLFSLQNKKLLTVQSSLNPSVAAPEAPEEEEEEEEEEAFSFSSSSLLGGA